MKGDRGGFVQAMERFSIREFVVDPGGNVVIAPDGEEIRLEPKIMDVLCVLAGQPGEVVSRESLLDRVWGVEYGAEEGPTRAISRLRRVFGDSNSDPRFIQTIPKRGYRLVAPVMPIENGAGAPEGESPPLPMPPAAEADAGHASAGPVQDTAATTASGPGAAITGRVDQDQMQPGRDGSTFHGSFISRIKPLLIRMRKAHGPWLLALPALALAAGVILALRLMPGEDGTVPDVAETSLAESKTVAVLPFVNRSTKEDDAFLADGFHETLLTQLSKISGLQVISRTSMVQYRETDKSAPRIARELGAAVVMEGSVQRSSKRVRINVQLIDGASDTHLWAEIYDVDLTPENLFAVQSDIAKAIADRLKVVLTRSDEQVLADVPTHSTAAFEAYLRGRSLIDLGQFSQPMKREAIREFDEAIRLDPEFAAARAGRAMALLQLYSGWTKDRNHLQAADEALTRAEAMAPEAVETIIARAFYYFWGLKDYDRANTLFRKAAEAAPNNFEAWWGQGQVALYDGRFEEAFAALERSRQLNPRNLAGIVEQYELHLIFGRFRKAEALVRHARLIDPSDLLTVSMAADLAIARGRPEAAWKEIMTPVSNPDWRIFYRRFIRAIFTRDVAKLEKVLAQWPEELRRPPAHPEVYTICRAYLLERKGQEAQSRALFDRIEARLKGKPEWEGWLKRRMPYYRGDAEGLRKALKDWDRTSPKPALERIKILHFFAFAFARAGDAETALDFMEAHQRQTAPSAYLWNSIHPDFDGLRDHPRYLALKAEYEEWARENGFE